MLSDVHQTSANMAFNTVADRVLESLTWHLLLVSCPAILRFVESFVYVRISAVLFVPFIGSATTRLL